MEEFKLDYNSLRGPAMPQYFTLPIGHVSRPSAFSRISSSESQQNEEESLKFEICLKSLVDGPSFKNEEAKRQDDQFSTISGCEVQTPKLAPTPSFNPECSDVFQPKESKEEIIAEFMNSLSAPSAKPRAEKAIGGFSSGNFQFSVNQGCEMSHRGYTLEVGTDLSDVDISPAQTSKFSHIRPRVGFYTPEVRRAKILKYRAKIQRWLKGQHKNKDLYCKRRLIAKNKKRVGGKFVKQNL